MEQKITPECESRMVNAIEKAASRTVVNEQLDRSDTLASELKAANIPSRFAKVATAAYNKRLTVMTFKQRSDEDKVKSFPLADDVKVASLMDGKIPETRTSTSEASPFSIIIQKTASGSMRKSASLNPTTTGRLPFEYRVDRGVFLSKLEGMVEKHAAIFDEKMQKQASLECQLRQDCKKLADDLVKNATAFDTLCNLHGERFAGLMREYMPAGTDFSKTANGAIRPFGHIYDRVDDLLSKKSEYEDNQAFLGEYAEGLMEFSKSASTFMDRLYDKDCGKLEKKAVDIPDVLLGGTLGGALPGLAEGIMGGGVGVIGGVEQNINNAREMYHKGLDNSKHPASVTDAEFLVQDRYRDRMLGWADMAADPQFSMYPSEQIFNATQRAMNLDTSLERPDRREVLRTTVGQLLAQNNRFSNADIAALATTIKSLESSKGNLQATGRAAVKALDSVRGTDPAVLNLNLAEQLDKAWSRAGHAGDLVRAGTKEIETKRKEQEAEAKEEEREAKRLQERAEDKAQREKERAEDRKEREKDRAHQKDVADADRKARTDQADKDRLSNEQVARAIAYNDHERLRLYGGYLGALRAAQQQGRGNQTPPPPPPGPTPPPTPPKPSPSPNGNNGNNNNNNIYNNPAKWNSLDDTLKNGKYWDDRYAHWAAQELITGTNTDISKIQNVGAIHKWDKLYQAEKGSSGLTDLADKLQAEFNTQIKDLDADLRKAGVDDPIRRQELEQEAIDRSRTFIANLRQGNI